MKGYEHSFFGLLGALLWAILPLIPSLQAQVTRVDDRRAFSGPLLHFEDLNDGSEVGGLLDKFGVQFLAEGGGSVRAKALTLFPATILPQTNTVLRNEGLSAISSAQSMILRFLKPAQRVGLTLGNGSPATTATISAYTETGELLGSVQQTGIEELVGPFVGLETSHPAGISTVVLDYGEDPAEEQISDLRFDYLKEATFRVVIPQIAAGHAQGRRLATVIHLQNLYDEISAVVRFKNTSGNPLQVSLEGAVQTEWEGQLGSRVHKALVVEASEGELLVGYAVVEATGPLSAQAVYRTLSSTDLPVEAAIQGTPERPQQVASVEIDRDDGLDTGIALVNRGVAEANVSLLLRDASGQSVGRNTGRKRVQLAPGQHVAQFLTELFGDALDEAGYQDFAGSLLIEGDQPIAATVLRAYQGFAVSSLVIDSVWNPGQPD